MHVGHAVGFLRVAIVIISWVWSISRTVSRIGVLWSRCLLVVVLKVGLAVGVFSGAIVISRRTGILVRSRTYSECNRSEVVGMSWFYWRLMPKVSAHLWRRHQFFFPLRSTFMEELVAVRMRSFFAVVFLLGKKMSPLINLAHFRLAGKISRLIKCL